MALEIRLQVPCTKIKMESTKGWWLLLTWVQRCGYDPQVAISLRELVGYNDIGLLKHWVDNLGMRGILDWPIYFGNKDSMSLIFVELDCPSTYQSWWFWRIRVHWRTCWRLWNVRLVSYSRLVVRQEEAASWSKSDLEPILQLLALSRNIVNHT